MSQITINLDFICSICGGEMEIIKTRNGLEVKPCPSCDKDNEIELNRKDDEIEALRADIETLRAEKESDIAIKDEEIASLESRLAEYE